MPIRVAAILASVPDLPVSELRMLLGAVLKQPLVWLLTHGEDIVSPDCCGNLDALIARRRNGEPMAYLLGYREFYGREFFVSPAVLIPRPETEMLVDLVKELVSADDTGRPPGRKYPGERAPLSILDLGTGSGCIAISIALECPQSLVTAVDRSAAALLVASANARKARNIEFVESDWFAALSGRRFDIIVSNPPYVAVGDPHLNQGDLRFEPASALSSGSDGLAALSKIIVDAPHHLSPHGMLALEHGYDQAAGVRQLLVAAGFTEITQHADIAGITRVSCGVVS